MLKLPEISGESEGKLVSRMPKQMVIPVVFNKGKVLYIPDYEKIPGIRAMVALLDPRVVNILPQVRKTFPEAEIVELANDIAEHGLQEPPNIVLFDEGGAIGYINLVNRFWHESVEFESQTSVLVNGVKHYIDLADGERRSRAIRYLLEHGCDKCLEEAKGKPIGDKCFRKHFPTGLVQYSLDIERTPEELFEAQMVCNNHVQPPMPEVVRGWEEYWRYLRQKDEGMSLKQFARKVGRSESTIRSALKYCTLPDMIQELVINKTISYGIALELTRLKDHKVSDLDLIYYWAAGAVARGDKVDDFRARVSAYIENLNSNQMTLFELTGSASKQRRKTIQHHTALNLRGFISYIQSVQRAAKAGVIGSDASPLSDGETIKLVLRAIGEIRDLSPQMRKLRKKIETDGLDVILDKAEQQASQLQETLIGG